MAININGTGSITGLSSISSPTISGGSVPLGDATAPGIVFSGDPNTGIYSPGADQVAISTGGSPRVTVTSTGVGVGTSSPADTHSFGGVLDLSGSQGGALYVRNQTSASKYGAFGFYDTDIYVTTYATGNIRFNTGSSGTERMRITSAGNVGIGTTSPNNKLEVVGAGYFTDWVYTGSSSGSRGISSDSSTRALLFGVNGSEVGRFDTSGRLLVGTSSGSLSYSSVVVRGNPAASGVQGTLELSRASLPSTNGAGIGTIAFTDSSSNLGATIAAIAEGSWTSGSNHRSRLEFSTTADGASSPTERMRITNNGYFRASNTGSYLYGSATHEFANDVSNNLTLGVYNSNSSFTDTVLQAVAARNTSNSTYNLFKCSRLGIADVFLVRDSGNAQNANNSYTGTSDAKLKENIVDATPQWDDIKALKVRKFNFKEETGYSTHTQIGLIAQEVETVSPGLVDEAIDRDTEGNDLGTVTKSVNYSVLYMKAVKALQEAMERIETLEASNADLLARVTALESA